MSRFDGEIAVVCANNINRSMSAHEMLKNHGYDVRSFGSNRSIRVNYAEGKPSKVYEYGVSFDQIYSDIVKLVKDDPSMFEKLKRNAKVKTGPENITSELSVGHHFPLILTFGDIIYDVVIEYLHWAQGSSKHREVIVINIPIEDTLSEAEEGSQKVLRLVRKIELRGYEWKTLIGDIIEEFEREEGLKINFSSYFM